MSGKLTAEQVRESIERHFGKVAVLDDGKPVEWRDDWVCKVGIDYKGIADELNATLGDGECDANGTNFWEWEWSDFTAYYEHELSCGHVVNTMEPEPPNFCPECGRKIRKAVKR